MLLDGIPLIGLSAPAILGLAVLMLLTGRIVPRASLTEAREESERWRKAYEAEREARLVCQTQTKELGELAKTTHAIIVAMFETVGHTNRKAGGPNESSVGDE